MDKIIQYIRFPTVEEWEKYIELRVFKSRRSLIGSVVISTLLLYVFLVWMIGSPPSEVLTTRMYQKSAPTLLWVSPFLLYFVQVSDLRKVLGRSRAINQKLDKTMKVKE